MSDEDLQEKVLALYAEGLKAKEIAPKFGITWQKAAAIKAQQTISEQGGASAEPTSGQVTPSLSGLEREMNRALRRNIERLDPGFAIADGGAERTVSRGRIDILVRDANERLVVIELKPDLATDGVLAQVLDYVQALVDEGEERPRAMIVALGFSPRLRNAARAAGVELVTYEVDFVFNRHFEDAADSEDESGLSPRARTALNRADITRRAKADQQASEPSWVDETHPYNVARVIAQVLGLPVAVNPHRAWYVLGGPVVGESWDGLGLTDSEDDGICIGIESADQPGFVIAGAYDERTGEEADILTDDADVLEAWIQEWMAK